MVETLLQTVAYSLFLKNNKNIPIISARDENPNTVDFEIWKYNTFKRIYLETNNVRDIFCVSDLNVEFINLINLKKLYDFNLKYVKLVIEPSIFELAIQVTMLPTIIKDLFECDDNIYHSLSYIRYKTEEYPVQEFKKEGIRLII